MAKNSYDMNRQRKLYPLRRKTPVIFSADVAAITIDFTVSDSSKTVPILGTLFNALPAVTISATDNVNVWISAVTHDVVTKRATVTVKTSALFVGSVHLIAAEITE